MTHTPTALLATLAPMVLSAAIPNGYLASWAWALGVAALGLMLAAVHE